MQKNKNISILSTRPLEQTLIDKALATGIVLDVFSFIETESVTDRSTVEKITGFLHQPATVVFTSMNAVEAVAAQLTEVQPAWKIFCIGHATQKLVQENFGEASVAGTADSAMALAETIIELENTASVIFFCGDQRRDELPAKLKKHGIEVNELVVYQTRITAAKMDKIYDGIAFFSPSAVHSFFSLNTLPQQTTVFAIGRTTADAVKTYAVNTVVIASSPAKDLLILQAMQYFEVNPIQR